MTHEQKPESAKFRTREAQIDGQIEDIFEAHEAEDAERSVSKGDLRLMLEAAHKQAEARGAAEQRRKDEETRELISLNLDRPGLIEWSVHILGPDDVHPCRSRAEAEELAEETNILAGSTNKGRSDDEFVTYAAYVVPRFKADQVAEQRRKDAEGAERTQWRNGNFDAWKECSPYPNSRYHKNALMRRYPSAQFQTIYTCPANVAALVAEAVAAERERCAKVCEERRETFADPAYAGGPTGAVSEMFACKACAAAIREGGGHD